MIYWITETYLKVSTPLTKNISATDILPNVKTQSDIWIKYHIGSYFNDILLAKYNNQTLTSGETILVSHIQSVVAWRAAAECVFDLTYPLKNKGLQQQNGENSESVEFNIVVFGMKHYNQKAEFYTNVLNNYLIDNESSFPDYASSLNNDSLIKGNCSGNISPFGNDMFFI